MAVNLFASLVLYICFYQHDRRLLERRMIAREKVGVQKIIMLLVKILAVTAYLLCGFDCRAGWSRVYLAPVRRGSHCWRCW